MVLEKIPDLEKFDSYLKNEKVDMLRAMMIIRETEKTIADMVEHKEIKTPCHLYIGQEAVAAGVSRCLEKSDYVFSNHRAHGHYLAKGGSLKKMFAEILGRETGCSGGRGGSMHLCAPDVGIMGTSSIVAGSLGVGLGGALASAIRKDNRVTVIYHGDTVIEEGIWNESANLAALKKLPVIYVCENNLYSAHMPLLKRRVADNLCEVAAAHGLETHQCDGNNVFEVTAAAKEAVEKARTGKGAQFLECRTYRYRGHVGPNDDIDKGLRSKDELDFWMERCPIKVLRSYLIDKGTISTGEYSKLEKEVMEEIRDAVVYAKKSAYPPADTLSNHLYA